MCGLAGILLGPRERGRRDLVEVSKVFARLLVLSEHRGPQATGVASMTAASKWQVEKAPLSAHQFLETDAYRRFCGRLVPETTLLMGHTRWPTQGSHLENQNNQPLASARTIGLLVAHNGNFPDVDRYFARFGLVREWEVDSELLLRLAERHLGPTAMNLRAFLRDVACSAGQLAAVLAMSAPRGKVVFLRRDRPLHVAWHPTRRLLAYASELAILEQAVPAKSTWQFHSLPAETAWVISCAEPSSPMVKPL